MELNAKKLNTAQRLMESLGAACEPDPKQAHGAKNHSATKAGSGRYHKQGSGNAEKPVRAYRALMAAWAAKRVTKAPMRDDHGAITLTGQNPRRKWMAGISAQRGF